MQIFINLVVVFTLLRVIISLTNFLLIVFPIFFWVTVHLTKAFIVLTPPPLGFISPYLPNLMKFILFLNTSQAQTISSLQFFRTQSFPCQFAPILSHAPFSTSYSISPMYYFYWYCGLVFVGYWSCCRSFFPHSAPSFASFVPITELPTPSPAPVALLVSHPMLTCTKAGILKTQHPVHLAPMGSFGLFLTLLAYTKTKIFKSTAKNHAWLAAMDDEVQALQYNRT